MEHPPEPIPMPSRGQRPAAVQTGEHWGRELGHWIHLAGEWKDKAEQKIEEMQHFWDEVQEPEGRSRHIWTLMAIAAGTGFVLGLVMRRPRS